MDDFENSHSEKKFDINNLCGNDKLWVPLMLGLIFRLPILIHLLAFLRYLLASHTYPL